MAFRGIKHFRDLPPVTSAGNNSDSASFSTMEHFTPNHSDWLCLHLNDLITRKSVQKYFGYYFLKIFLMTICWLLRRQPVRPEDRRTEQGKQSRRKYSHTQDTGMHKGSIRQTKSQTDRLTECLRWTWWTWRRGPDLGYGTEYGSLLYVA